jgi:nucleoside-diphosphate-sugar epimerase
MKRAFLTGGTGFLGLHVAEQLKALGYHVIALHRPSSDTRRLKAIGVELRVGDVSDIASLEAAVPRGVDGFFHVAGNTSLWKGARAALERDNIGGARNAASVALSTGARRFVHTSSIAVYGLQEAPITEHSQKRGRTSWIDYARTKALGEEQVLEVAQRGLDTVIVNPAHIIGRYDVSNWGRVIRLVATGKLPGVPSGDGSFCDAEAVARAHVAALEHGRTGQNYILGGPNMSFLSFVGMVGELLGKPVPKRATPAFVLRAVGKLGEWRARKSGEEPDITPEGAAMVTAHVATDSTRATVELGFDPRSVRTVLEEQIAWMRAERVLD